MEFFPAPTFMFGIITDFLLSFFIRKNQLLREKISSCVRYRYRNAVLGNRYGHWRQSNLQSKKFCVKMFFCRHYFSPLNSFMKKGRIWTRTSDKWIRIRIQKAQKYVDPVPDPDLQHCRNATSLWMCTFKKVLSFSLPYIIFRLVVSSSPDEADIEAGHPYSPYSCICIGGNRR